MNEVRRFGYDPDKSGAVREEIITLFQFRGHVSIPYSIIEDVGDSHIREDGYEYALTLALDLADRYGWINDEKNERFVKVYKS